MNDSENVVTDSEPSTNSQARNHSTINDPDKASKLLLIHTVSFMMFYGVKTL